ncbi:hypothetical protein DWW47_08040 [Odoribacter splanchnicus]|uniref:Uncharacterized protein n=1 Tax=Odoribacter splanchnicus TaxID=28118 RepID=A0A3D4ZDU1_9BACT|nr:hypothetical protein [Odoribacter sp.]MBS6592947.1 hypothetical protein [Odoribacter splanchnicus]MBP8906163.1 hypothetical protein [Odoribacter sp.]MBQ7844434.1 hypothetical protein [Odoribacter sp.]MBT9659411.1 hypothetical protein [Odoribacter splanchnicus]
MTIFFRNSGRKVITADR